MVKDGKSEERKIYNAPFLRVFDYLAEEKHMNQGEFSKFIGIESGYISLLRSGSKRVGPKYIALISVEFSKHFEDQQHLNPDYIYGKSPYMIIENVPDDEVLDKISRGAMTADDTEMTDLWLFDYVGDELVQSADYSPEDDDWGAPSLTLKLGTHHIYFVASRGDQPTVDENAETITWGTPKDTFWAPLTLNVTSGGNTSQSVTLSRVATKMRLQINDLVPDGVATLNITPDTWYFGLNYTTGAATSSETRERSVTVPSAYVGTTGRLVASFFGLSDATEWITDIAVAAKDGDGNIIGSANITDAPFMRNRISSFSGNLFNGEGSMDVTLGGDWSADYTATW